MKNKNQIWRWLLICLVLLVGVLVHGVWCNKALVVTQVTVETQKLAPTGEGFRIAQVSDLHNARFGQDNSKLLEMIKNVKPDMIAITGDMVDSTKTDVDVAISFAKEAVKIAPCYYVTGNHEAVIARSEYERLENGLKVAGVTVLRDEVIELSYEGSMIQIMGVNDPSFFLYENRYGTTEEEMRSKIEELKKEQDDYTVLLSHRPELFEIYCNAQIDLVLSGHAHGGQFRIPFVGGVIAPNQGLFPEYDEGLFTNDETHMVVSRGVGNSIIPLRINNRPEVVVVEIKGQ